jgi:hypothetical protein
MARRLEWMRVTIRFDRQKDGTYVARVPFVEAEINDPKAEIAIERGPIEIKINNLAYNPEQPCGELITQCFDRMKAEGGVS